METESCRLHKPGSIITFTRRWHILITCSPSRRDVQIDFHLHASEFVQFLSCQHMVKFHLCLLSMLLISRSMDLRKTCFSSICSIDKLSSPFFRSSASSFSSQYLILFLNSSRSCVLLLPTPFTSESGYMNVVFLSLSDWTRNPGSCKKFSKQQLLKARSLRIYRIICWNWG